MNLAQRKRTNAAQMDYLVEKLSGNRILALGNSGDPRIKDAWVALAQELNSIGCARTADEWRNIWTQWVTKVRGKARRIRASVTGTGGGPPVPPLSDIEEKILGISGRAAVYGFAALETEVRPSAPPPDHSTIPEIEDLPSERNDSDQGLSPPPNTMLESIQVPPPDEGILFGAREARTHPYRRHRNTPRASRVQRLDPSAATAAMLENGRMILQGLMAIAEAMTRLTSAVQNINGLTGNL